MRLPYGKHTGVEVADRLNIIAHDRFQEIIDEANKGDLVLKLKQVILDAPSADDKKASTGFHPFKLDLSSLHLQPSER